MSYQEKRALVSLCGTIVINLVYSAYMIQRFPDTQPYDPAIFRYWGAFVLILIPVTIVAKILIHIGFSIINTILTQEEEPAFDDERDKLIDLKSLRASGYLFGIGVMIGMVALVLDQPPSLLFIILLCAGIVSEIVTDISQFFFYRRGF